MLLNKPASDFQIPSSKANAVFVSDIHLGSKDSRAEEFIAFLNMINTDTLYLVGDVVDFWALKRKSTWKPAHFEALKTIHNMSQSGVKVIYIPGNHDCCVREFVENNIMGVEVLQNTIHTSVFGKKLLVTHGDQFDETIKFNFLIKTLGDTAYDLLMFLHRLNAWKQKIFKKPYWSLANYIKTRIGKAQEFIEAYENACLHDVKEKGLDGIICGHIHQAAIKERNGLLYINDGDWVESCTAVIEDQYGVFQLFEWSKHGNELEQNTNSSEQNKKKDSKDTALAG